MPGDLGTVIDRQPQDAVAAYLSRSRRQPPAPTPRFRSAVRRRYPQVAPPGKRSRNRAAQNERA